MGPRGRDHICNSVHTRKSRARGGRGHGHGAGHGLGLGLGHGYGAGCRSPDAGLRSPDAGLRVPDTVTVTVAVTVAVAVSPWRKRTTGSGRAASSPALGRPRPSLRVFGKAHALLEHMRGPRRTPAAGDDRAPTVNAAHQLRCAGW
ncbi:hypothetical protein FIV42_26660 [Persicimonas caeni]|uniref:Uncharacterized protein n=1 Tax=Persicimonas caeni TaxID=2292766 RepID=A0A4Y6Q0T7_PERCE|nr:hypothetical protein FIV42_26660 [Persicimonas caeni]QED35415.1 hypothetical protein FRD00_26655 [Persicimonas caeni]